MIKSINSLRKPSEGEFSKYFNVVDVKIGVEAREMEISPDGTLKDKVIQNCNHHAYAFATKFTELFDYIAEEYPVFIRLKQIAKANLLAK